MATTLMTGCPPSRVRRHDQGATIGLEEPQLLAVSISRGVVGHHHVVDEHGRSEPDLVSTREPNGISYAQGSSPRAVAASEILERRVEAADDDARVMP